MRILAILMLLCPAMVWGQSRPEAYVLYNQKGKKTRYRKLLRDVRQADVILFGEYHNNPISHWLQLELARDMEGNYDLGLEMFETDEQAPLDSFMALSLGVPTLDSLTGGLWPNFTTDYLPLLEQARADDARVVATNAPRRYARMVFRRGLVVLRSLPESERAYLPPLPVPYDPELPGYAAMNSGGAGMGGHGGETFPMAQAIKDATMGWFIAKNVRPGVPFLHLNGSYHSDNYEGIGWYLRQYKPQLRVVTITTVEQADTGELLEENMNKAHYTIVVPETMTKTY